MIDRVVILALAGSTVLGALLLLEWNTGQPAAHSPVAPAPMAEKRMPLRIQGPRIEELVATTLERPLFTATRRPPDRALANPAAGPELPNLRLTGVLIEPEHHIAIFTMPGTKPLVRSEGESVNEWRLDTIAPREVTLVGPTGSTTLEPKTDPNIVRSAQPQPQAQPQPLPQAMRAASTTGQPIGVATRPPFPLPAAAPPRPLPIPSARPPGPVRAPNPPRPPQ